MSLRPYKTPDWPLCFPRVSGDEPGLGVLSVVPSTFSPRERG